jgi:hypothetical protein
MLLFQLQVMCRMPAGCSRRYDVRMMPHDRARITITQGVADTVNLTLATGRVHGHGGSANV